MCIMSVLAGGAFVNVGRLAILEIGEGSSEDARRNVMDLVLYVEDLYVKRLSKHISVYLHCCKGRHS